MSFCIPDRENLCRQYWGHFLIVRSRRVHETVVGGVPLIPMHEADLVNEGAPLSNFTLSLHFGYSTEVRDLFDPLYSCFHATVYT